jgi:YVTN family beta-propeller protein
MQIKSASGIRVRSARLVGLAGGSAILAAAVLVPAGRASAAVSYSATTTVSLAAHPRALAVDPAVHQAFIATDEGTMLEVDTTTKAVVGSVPIGSEPNGIALDTNRPPVAQQAARYGALDQPAVLPPVTVAVPPIVYVSNTGSGTITVIDSATNAVTATIDLGAYTAEGLAIDPSTHTLYAADSFDNVLLVINGSTHTLTKAVPVGASPFNLAIDLAAHRVFVLGTNTVSVVDATTNTVAQTFGVGISFDVAVDPTAHRLYVTGNKSVQVLDETSGGGLATIPLTVSPSNLGLDIGGHRLFMSLSASELDVLDTSANPLPAAVAVSGVFNPSNIAVDPTTHTAYVTDYVDEKLFVVQASSVVSRLAGSDRFGTAVAVSKAEFPSGGAGAVVLARGDAYPDALVGAPLAAAKNAPLLLTTGASLPPATKAEVQRVLAPGGTVFVLGGTSAVPASVADELTQLGYVVTRYSGANRFATAVRVADALGDPGTVLLATGVNFPDALSAGVAAVKAGGVVLLTSGATLPSETSAYLSAHPGTVYAVGGPAAKADPAAAPLVGSDRYATSVAVAAKFFTAPNSLGLATGLSFPDALSGGALLGHLGVPLVLVSSSSVPSGVATYLAGVKAMVTKAYLFGGPNTVTTATEAALNTDLTS